MLLVLVLYLVIIIAKNKTMLTIDFTLFPTLYTERLQLREMTDNDVGGLFEMRSNPINMQYISRHIAQTIDDAQALVDRVKKLLANNEGITWAICLKDNPAIIGTYGFWRIDAENHRTEIGYMLHQDYQGKGIMQEAMQTGLEYAFKVMKIHAVEASINPANAGSINLAERNGFIREGYFKDMYYFNGKYVDTCIYTLFNPYE